jgi:hypothetical protein
MATFDITKTALGKLLEDVVEGRIQLPDFQRGWVWDDAHIGAVFLVSCMAVQLKAESQTTSKILLLGLTIQQQASR